MSSLRHDWMYDPKFKRLSIRARRCVFESGCQTESQFIRLVESGDVLEINQVGITTASELANFYRDHPVLRNERYLPGATVLDVGFGDEMFK